MLRDRQPVTAVDKIRAYMEAHQRVVEARRALAAAEGTAMLAKTSIRDICGGRYTHAIYMLEVDRALCNRLNKAGFSVIYELVYALNATPAHKLNGFSAATCRRLEAALRDYGVTVYR